MLITFTPNAWEDYTYWQTIDKKLVKRINELLKDIKQSPFDGIGKPEAMKHDLAGFWSRRIDHEHRLVYQITDNAVLVIACLFHYD